MKTVSRSVVRVAAGFAGAAICVFFAVGAFGNAWSGGREGPAYLSILVGALWALAGAACLGAAYGAYRRR